MRIDIYERGATSDAEQEDVIQNRWAYREKPTYGSVLIKRAKWTSYSSLYEAGFGQYSEI